jgi:hypothetical protein
MDVSFIVRRQGYVLNGRDSIPSKVKMYAFRPVLGPTRSPMQWAMFQKVKRQGHEADHSSPTSAEVKKTWICTSTPPYASMA